METIGMILGLFRPGSLRLMVDCLVRVCICLHVAGTVESEIERGSEPKRERKAERDPKPSTPKL